MSTTTPLVASELESMTVKTLKQLLADRQLKLGGRKAELIDRLMQFDAEQNAEKTVKNDVDDAIDDDVVVDDVVVADGEIASDIDVPPAVPEAAREAVCEALGNEIVTEVVEELVMDTFDEVFDSSLDEERSSTSSLKATLIQRQSIADEQIACTDEIVAVESELQTADQDANDDDEEDEIVTVNIAAASAADPINDKADLTDPIAGITQQLDDVSDVSATLSMAHASLSPTMLLDGDGANDATLLLHGDAFSSTSVSPAESPYQQSTASSARKAAAVVAAAESPITASATTTSRATTTSTLRIGARVSVDLADKSHLGTLKYVGLTDFAAGEWFGVQLDKAFGKHDGTVQNVRYFHCPTNHGVFVRANAVSAAAAASVAAAATRAPAPARGTTPVSGLVQPKVLSAKSESATNVSTAQQPTSIAVGMRVGIKGRAEHGTVRFIGTTKFADGEWCGLELQRPNGKNDGSVNGHKYFVCAPKCGLFVPTSQVTPISRSNNTISTNKQQQLQQQSQQKQSVTASQ
jgi:hypothetical protein